MDRKAYDELSASEIADAFAAGNVTADEIREYETKKRKTVLALLDSEVQAERPRGEKDAGLSLALIRQRETTRALENTLARRSLRRPPLITTRTR